MWTVKKFALAIWATAGLLQLCSGPAAAQTREQLIEQYKAQCIPQNRGRPDAIRACVVAHVQTAVREIALSRPPSGSILQLVESTPWLVKNTDQGNAKGVIYFVRGWSPGPPVLDDYRLPPYFVRSLNETGWDVIDAKVAHGLPAPGVARGHYLALEAEPFVRDRVKALKGQGYRRIVLAGASWGAWVAMLAAGNNADVDALVLATPNAFGTEKNAAGQPNFNFSLNLTQFEADVAAVKAPTVLLAFADDDREPGGRGDAIEKHFAPLNVPHLVIDRPIGFSGHVAAFLPVFDYAFGKCIVEFVDDPKPRPCIPPPLSNDDFRSIVGIRQIGDERKRLDSANALIGKAYVVYMLGKVDRRYEYVSATQRATLQPLTTASETFSFRDGTLCVEQSCSALVKWSEREILEFDPGSGKLRAWWVEQR